METEKPIVDLSCIFDHKQRKLLDEFIARMKQAKYNEPVPIPQELVVAFDNHFSLAMAEAIREIRKTEHRFPHLAFCRGSPWSSAPQLNAPLYATKQLDPAIVFHPKFDPIND